MRKISSPRPLPKIIAFSTLLYRWLLCLGPGAFRRNYAVPAVQVFRQCCVDAYNAQGTAGVLALWPALIGETLSGLIAEYFNDFLGRKQPMLPTIRRSMVAAFWAFVLFGIACIALGRASDPAAPFNAAGRAHPEIAFAYSIVIYSFDIALLATVLGGVPFIFSALKQASSAGLRGILHLFAFTPRQALFLLVAALLLAICFLSFLLGTEFIFGLPACTAANGCVAGLPPLAIIGGFALIIGATTLIIFTVLAITALLSLLVLRSEFSQGMLRFALMPIAILTLVMAASTLAAAFWTIRLWVAEPQFAASSAGLGDGQKAWVISIIAAMALSTVIAANAFWRGLRASRLRVAV